MRHVRSLITVDRRTLSIAAKRISPGLAGFFPFDKIPRPFPMLK